MPAKSGLRGHGFRQIGSQRVQVRSVERKLSQRTACRFAIGGSSAGPTTVSRDPSSPGDGHWGFPARQASKKEIMK